MIWRQRTSDMVAFQSSIKAGVFEDFVTDSLKEVRSVTRLVFRLTLIFYIKCSTRWCH